MTGRGIIKVKTLFKGVTIWRLITCGVLYVVNYFMLVTVAHMSINIMSIVITTGNFPGIMAQPIFVRGIASERWRNKILYMR